MADRRIFTVSRLTQHLGQVLEHHVPPFWVEGEISNLRAPGSGHAYFTLKDDGAQIRAVLFRNRLRYVRFQPADGQHVLIFGALELYPQRGEYQLVVERMEPRGLGALQLAFEQLKQRLSAQGLFAQERKRPLPHFPRKIGIVTSPRGAAISDVLRVLQRRFGELHIVLRPVRVQGEGAAAEIAAGIADLNALGGVDVIIVGRGGGSLEDLWAFNEEVVARAIFESKVPIVSAVGHEVDFTIADFVADVRAPTPSAAAELVVREKGAIGEAVRALDVRLRQAMARGLARRGERLKLVAGRRVLTDAGRPLRDAHRRVDDLDSRLRAAIAGIRRHAGHRVALSSSRLRASSPFAKLAHDRRSLAHLRGRLTTAVDRTVDRAKHRFRITVGRLDTLSPLGVLRRGYSLTRRPSGEIVRTASQVAPGDPVTVLLHEGSLDCHVVETRERDDRPQV
jgi:exodeoxyribonuclease VII large subunit